jgi:hypothetical protein
MLDPDPDPLVRGADPHQNVTDPQHCKRGGKSRRLRLTNRRDYHSNTENKINLINYECELSKKFLTFFFR